MYTVCAQTLHERSSNIISSNFQTVPKMVNSSWILRRGPTSSLEIYHLLIMYFREKKWDKIATNYVSHRWHDIQPACYMVTFSHLFCYSSYFWSFRLTLKKWKFLDDDLFSYFQEKKWIFEFSLTIFTSVNYLTTKTIEITANAT